MAMFMSATKYKSDDPGVAVFLESTFQIFMFKYAWFIYVAGLLVCLAATVIIVGKITLSMSLTYSLVLAPGYVFYKFPRYFAYRIILDSNKKTASLFMIGRDEPLLISYDDLLEIEYNAYIFIKTRTKTILCGQTHDMTLAVALNKILAIKWGFFCSVFGPPKKFRDEVSL